MRWPGNNIPADDLSCSSDFVSTDSPPSSVITLSASFAKPTVIPARDLKISQDAYFYKLNGFFAYPVFTILNLYEPFSSKITGGMSLASPTQSTGRPGIAMEQLNRPAPFTSMESGTGCPELGKTAFRRSHPVSPRTP